MLVIVFCSCKICESGRELKKSSLLRDHQYICLMLSPNRRATRASLSQTLRFQTLVGGTFKSISVYMYRVVRSILALAWVEEGKKEKMENMSFD